MNANELAELIGHLENAKYVGASKAATMLRQQQGEIEALKKRCLDEIFNRTYADRSAEVMCEYWELAQAEVDGLKVRIERMIEKASHHEALAHAGGFEAGRKMGMQQERALWELAASTQEIENINKPNPHIGNSDKEPYTYKMGDIDWTKALK